MKNCCYAVFALGICCLFSSCGPKQAVAQSPQYADPFGGGSFEAPCQVYNDEYYFAATGIATGSAKRKGVIQKTALTNAQDLVAQMISHVVEGEVKSFFETIGQNAGTDISEQEIGGINHIIVGVINDTDPCCVRFSGIDEKGDTECYVGIKVSKKKIVDAVAENLSKSQKEDIRNRAEEFRAQVAEDLKKFKDK